MPALAAPLMVEFDETLDEAASPAVAFDEPFDEAALLMLAFDEALVVAALLRVAFDELLVLEEALDTGCICVRFTPGTVTATCVPGFEDVSY